MPDVITADKSSWAAGFWVVKLWLPLVLLQIKTAVFLGYIFITGTKTWYEGISCSSCFVFQLTKWHTQLFNDRPWAKLIVHLWGIYLTKQQVSEQIGSKRGYIVYCFLSFQILLKTKWANYSYTDSNMSQPVLVVQPHTKSWATTDVLWGNAVWESRKIWAWGVQDRGLSVNPSVYLLFPFDTITLFYLPSS